jgi:hypothetical protein
VGTGGLSSLTAAASEAVARTLGAQSIKATVTRPGESSTTVFYNAPDRLRILRTAGPTGPVTSEELVIGNTIYTRQGVPPSGPYQVQHVANGGAAIAFNQVFLPLEAALRATGIAPMSGSSFEFTSGYGGTTTGHLQVSQGWVSEADALISTNPSTPLEIRVLYSDFNSAQAVNAPSTAVGP